MEMTMTKDATTKDMTTKDMTTQDTIRTILDLWKAVPRDGVDGLIKFLQESDFFSAPCSTQFHLACPGGLARHSLNVYQLLKEKVDRFAVCIPHESVIIAGLGHDLCKVNFYKEGGEPCTEAQHNYLSSLANQYGWKCAPFKERFMPGGKLRKDIPAAQASILIDWLKNRSSQPMPPLPISWSVDDKLPLGHGEKSLSILQDFISLTEIEKLAIRWHMGPTEPGVHFGYPAGYAFRAAIEKHPFVTLLFCADLEAAHVLEGG